MMKTRELMLPRKDIHLLQEIADAALMNGENRSTMLCHLARDLSHATPLDPDAIPQNLVTMETKVRVHDEEEGEEQELTIVYPWETNYEEGWISVLAPSGLALLGSREGETIEFETPAGQRRLKVMKIISQPKIEPPEEGSAD